MKKNIICTVTRVDNGFVKFYGPGWDCEQLRFASMADSNYNTYLHPDDAKKFANCPEPGEDEHIIRIVYDDGTIKNLA